MSKEKQSARPNASPASAFPQLAPPSRGFDPAPSHSPGAAHHLGAFSILPPDTEAPLQRKAASSTPLQRAAEDEDELQMKADPSITIQRQGEEEEEMQMKAEGAPAARPDVPLASGGGSALPPAVRAQMENSFSHDFSGVRIHQGGEAAQVGALAYTRGSDIHFQPGLYDPSSRGGQELLGHELTHVVQQSAGRVAVPQQKTEGSAPINADAGLEAEADAMGARAARGEAA